METDEPKRDPTSTDPENDDVETDQQKQGTVDVTQQKRKTSKIRQCNLHVYGGRLLSRCSSENQGEIG